MIVIFSHGTPQMLSRQTTDGPMQWLEIIALKTNALLFEYFLLLYLNYIRVSPLISVTVFLPLNFYCQ